MRLAIPQLSPGARLVPRVVVPAADDLVKFAAASSDYNLIHYDSEYAQSRGFSSVIVHGFFKTAMLSELVLEQVARGSWVRRLSATYRGVDHVGAPIVLGGVVKSCSDSEVVFDMWTENPSGERTTQCEAGVVVASEGVEAQA